MISRNFYSDKIISGLKHNSIVTLIGARQVGKTTLMEMFVKNKKHLWLNGQNPETAQLFENFSTIERYLKININSQIEGLLIIDEFQFISNISLYLKLLVDKYKKLKILCSGSSSLNILQQVNESLADRIRLIFVYSLTFDEYVKFQNEELYSQFQNTNKNDDINTLLPQIPVLLSEYLIYGGLPKISLAPINNEKKELLNDIYQTYLLKDVKQYIKNKDFVAFNKLLKILSSQIGSMLNINELSRLVQLSYKTCEEYINILEQMFIIHLVSPFYTNVRKEVSKMKKIFFCDIGLRNIVYSSFNDIDFRVDKGAIFENFAYLQLLRKNKAIQINYYRTKDGTEIDFIVHKNNEIIPIEVKYKRYNKVYKIRAISEFKKKNNVKTAFVVNLNLVEKLDNLHYIQPYLLAEI
ncbi:MAG: ATP-binding protein [Bacteroidota bacterium]|nr:ATP-binding protein [Bacteroidota bacterium]